MIIGYLQRIQSIFKKQTIIAVVNIFLKPNNVAEKGKSCFVKNFIKNLKTFAYGSSVMILMIAQSLGKFEAIL